MKRTSIGYNQQVPGLDLMSETSRVVSTIEEPLGKCKKVNIPLLFKIEALGIHKFFKTYLEIRFSFGEGDGRAECH